jgi:beta-xylosidase
MRGRAVVTAFVCAALLAAVAGCANPGAATPMPKAPAFAIDRDFPDPDVLRVGDTYYAYATNSAAVNVQVATSTDLSSWSVSKTDALPTLPDWTAPGKTWAPDVSEVSPGHFVMYFVAANIDPSLQCVSVATSDSPAGPFTASGSGPLVCSPDEGGAIDPASFVDTDGTAYLVWKNDGNCCGLDTWLQIAPVSPDRLSLAGPPTNLIKQSLAWEGNLVEAPTLVKHAETYVLFYSANDYAGAKYAIGYATSDSLLGPYTKAPKPLLSTSSSGDRFVGPGGQDLVTRPDGSTALVIHSWSDGLAYRGMSVLPLAWKGDRPSVRLR